MPVRRFSNLALPLAIVSTINAAAVTIDVSSTTGYPEVPFLLTIERGTVDEEVMLCTAKTATTFTVTRGYDDTTAVSHDGGVFVEHTTAAIDFREAGIARVTTTERDAFPAELLWDGRLIWNTTDDQLEFYFGAAWASVVATVAGEIPDLPASQITSGIFDVALIPDLDGSKITTGQFDSARVPNLDASKITTGEFSSSRIPNLAASKITSGTFADSRIPNLAASKITTGTFAIWRIPTSADQTSSSGSVVPTLGAMNQKMKAHTGTGSEILVSTGAPSGGQDGDLWLRY